MNRENGPGHIIDGTRRVNYYPAVAHLKSDPFETARIDSAMHARWTIDQIWTIIPAGNMAMEFLQTLHQYPRQLGNVISPAGLNYQSLQLFAYSLSMDRE